MVAALRIPGLSPARRALVSPVSSGASCSDGCACAPCARKHAPHASSDAPKSRAAGAVGPSRSPVVNSRQAALAASTPARVGRAAGDLFSDPFGDGSGREPTLEEMVARIPTAHFPREWATYNRARQTAWAREYLRAAAQRAVVNATLAEIPADQLPPPNVWARMNEADRRAWVQNFARERGLSQAATNDLIQRALTGVFDTLRDHLRNEYNTEVARIRADRDVQIARLGANAQGESDVLNGVQNSGGNGPPTGNQQTTSSMGGGVETFAIGALLLKALGVF